ncbi:unnamed protein product [Alopecurus aequalis]
MSPKPSSARRSLFPSPDEAVAPTPPSSPPPALVTLPKSQSASNSANLPPSQRLKNKSPAKEMDEGKPFQQPRAGHPSPGMASSSSSSDGVQEEEKEEASDNDGVQEDEKEEASDNEGVQEEEKEKASVNEGVQEEEEEALKTDLSASCPESNYPAGAGEKKKAHGVRVWSVEDEVRILECLVAHVKAHGKPPARAELTDVVIGLDKKEFTLVEIYEKVRRMRDRYYKLRGTAGARGDAEDRHKYELSSKIWGDSLLVPKREIKQNGPGQAPPKACVRRGFEELRRMYPQLTFLVEQIAVDGRECLKRAFEFIDDSKARELDAKVKKLRVSEMKIQVERSSSRKEVLMMLVKYMES